MNSPHLPHQTLTIALGPARDLEAARPTVMDLRRARGHALRRGDRRRAAAYALVIARRLETAQQRAA
jgi:hypothetical protein